MSRVKRSQSWARAAAVGGLATALVAVAAGAAREPLSGATPVSARSAAAPVTALYLLMIGAGIAGLTVLAVWLWPGRRRADDDELQLVHELPRMHWLWKLVAVLLPFALGAALIAAAMLGTNTAVHPRSGVFGPPGGVPSPSGRAGGAPVSGSGFAVPGWLPWTILAIVLLGVVAATGLVLLRARKASVRPESAETARGRAIGAAITALDAAGDPRQAVIAAYVAMQQTYSAHGVVRGRAESAREYLGRLLVASRATQAEATRLTGLFEEARFSTHPMTQRMREVALGTLTSLRDRISREPEG